MTTTRALFAIDPLTTADVFPGVHDPRERWNGWATPRFDLATVRKISVWLTRIYTDYDDARADITVNDDGTVTTFETVGDDQVWDTVTPDADGLYSIFTYAWCWEEISADVFRSLPDPEDV